MLSSEGDSQRVILQKSQRCSCVISSRHADYLCARVWVYICERLKGDAESIDRKFVRARGGGGRGETEMTNCGALLLGRHIPFHLTIGEPSKLE